MAYLLDTNVAIHLRDGDAAVTERVAALDGAVIISSITRVELEGGMYRGPAHATVRRVRLDVMLTAIPTVALDYAAADAYGGMLARARYSRRKLLDGVIAAKALVHRATLVTLNRSDFADVIGLDILGWQPGRAGILKFSQPKSRRTTVDIKRAGSQPSSKVPAEYFTGAVRLDPLFQASAPARAVGASVTFESGARTAWHTHSLGQTLIVTAEFGRAQRAGGPVEEIRPGDVVWFPPGEKHWHGAPPTTGMTHIAIQEALDGKAVEWMETVSDDQYEATPGSG